MKPRSFLAVGTLLAFLTTQGICPSPALALRPSVEGVQSGLEEKLAPSAAGPSAELRTGLEEVPPVQTLVDTIGSIQLKTVPIGEEQINSGSSLPAIAARPEAIVRIRTTLYVGGAEHLTYWHPKVSDLVEFWRQSVQRHRQLIELFRANADRTPAALITKIEEIMAPIVEKLPGAESIQPVAGGLEEQGVSRVMAVLAVQASEVSRRVGLEEFVARLRGAGKVVMLGAADSTIAQELRARHPGLLLIKSDQPLDWAVALAGLEENRVIFVGESQAARQLQRILPPGMRVVQAGGLEEILLALGFPPAVLDQVNAAGLESVLGLGREA